MNDVPRRTMLYVYEILMRYIVRIGKAAYLICGLIFLTVTLVLRGT